MLSRRLADSCERCDRQHYGVELGERMLLWCEGGPSIGRATRYPPPLEITVDGGMYVLVDDRPVAEWHYVFIDERRTT